MLEVEVMGIKRCVLFCLISLGFCNVTEACTQEGMLGIKFGQKVQENKLKVFESSPLGVDIYYQTATDIAPYSEILIGVTPISRQVFSISGRVYGDLELFNKIANEAQTNSTLKNVKWKRQKFSLRGDTDDTEIYIHPERISSTDVRKQIIESACTNKSLNSKLFSESRQLILDKRKK